MNHQVLEIVDPESGSRARVLVSLGFNCFSWRPMLEDGPREMIWADTGFESGDKRPSGSGIPLLFPFPGRIGGTTFRFEGRTISSNQATRSATRFMDSYSIGLGELPSKPIRKLSANFRLRSTTPRFSNAGRPIFASAFRTRFAGTNC